ncbi:MAG: SAM-dependent methyltransferase [Planctomycetota bacterium]|jgi:SAM-dependent methyltransferase
MSPSPVPPEWWRTFFDETYADFGLHPLDTPETLDRVADFLVEHLELQPGHRVFDQCCGLGRVSRPLCRRGVEVVGVDLAAEYVRRATRDAEREGLSATYFHADAREFVAPDPCDAAINWFTSIGYSEDDTENARLLRCALDSLRPGGRFVLECASTPRVLAHFQRCDVQRYPLEGGGEVLQIVEVEPDFKRGVIDHRWQYVYPDGRRDERRITCRMFMPHELVRLLEHCGFQSIRLFGSIDGEPYGRSSPRLIIVARRPLDG